MEVVLEGAVAVVTEVMLPHGRLCRVLLPEKPKRLVKSREEAPGTKACSGDGGGRLRTKQRLTPGTRSRLP